MTNLGLFAIVQTLVLFLFWLKSRSMLILKLKGQHSRTKQHNISKTKLETTLTSLSKKFFMLSEILSCILLVQNSQVSHSSLTKSASLNVTWTNTSSRCHHHPSLHHPKKVLSKKGLGYLFALAWELICSHKFSVFVLYCTNSMREMSSISPRFLSPVLHSFTVALLGTYIATQFQNFGRIFYYTWRLRYLGRNLQL